MLAPSMLPGTSLLPDCPSTATPLQSPSLIQRRTTLWYVMVWPEFSPRPIATSAFVVIGQSHTSPLAAPFLAAGTDTEICSPATDKFSASDSVRGCVGVWASALSMAALSLPSTCLTPLTTTCGV